MSTRDFVYWLQGYLELTGDTKKLKKEQVEMIKQHLGYVFDHLDKAEKTVTTELPQLPDFLRSGAATAQVC
jgi:hypothetical protein